MALTKGFEALATKLQEQASSELSNSDVCRWLSDACNDMGAYYIDHIGDGEDGDVIYCTNGDLKRTSYEITTVNGGKVTAAIDVDGAIDVLPRTTYEPEADDADHYASMEVDRKRAKLYSKLPVYERFISKGERAAADSSSFAGKGNSFPILKAEDVQAAVHSMGRAGPDNYDAGTLKKNITRIAKAKGFGGSLPKAWQSGASSEAARDLEITGDFIALKEGAVGQDGSAYLKLIAPGWGSSGYYSEEMLARDGAKAFPAGTKNFWDHQTDAEETARPEGSLRNLASVLSEDARYDANGPAGPGLYARAKVFQEFRQPVDDLAKHIGMSIRASGKAHEGKSPDGKSGTIIEQLTRGHSVDYVTTPGAGGQILQLFEAARGRKLNEGGADMDAAQLREVQDMKAELKKLRERAAVSDAANAIGDLFATVRVGEAMQQRITKRLLEGSIPLTAAGDLDRDGLKKLWEAETKEEAEYISRLSGGRIVTNMGSSAPQVTEADKEARRKETKRAGNDFAELFGMGKNHKAGRRIMREGRSAFNPEYNRAGDGQVISGVGVED
jgi:hypothetical protein